MVNFFRQRFLAVFLIMTVLFAVTGCGSNDPNSGIQKYTEQINKNPDDAEAYYNRGTTYYYSGQYERAIQDFNKAIELNPKYAEAYGNRGETYYELKNYEQALADLNKSIELGLSGKDLGEILYYRGLCYQATGNNDEAQADFAKAQELGYEG